MLLLELVVLEPPPLFVLWIIRDQALIVLYNLFCSTITVEVLYNWGEHGFEHSLESGIEN